MQHLFALLEMASSRVSSRFSSTASWMAATLLRTAAVDFVQQLQQKMRELGVGRNRVRSRAAITRWIATTAGNASSWPIAPLVHGEAPVKPPAILSQRFERSYERGMTDEFVEPIVITDGKFRRQRRRSAPIRDDDAVIFFNFRADRARQMTRALAEPDFEEFADPKRPENLFYVAMTQYDKTWPWLRYVIAPGKIAHILAQVFAEQNLKNLRCAETEKYAHVTYFFNGGVEKPFGGRRTNSGSFAEGGHLRSETGNERRRDRRNRREGRRKGRL